MRALGTRRGKKVDCIHTRMLLGARRHKLEGWLNIHDETQGDGGDAHGGKVSYGGRRVGICRHPWGGRRLWAETACGLPCTSPTPSPKESTPRRTKGMFTMSRCCHTRVRLTLAIEASILELNSSEQ